MNLELKLEKLTGLQKLIEEYNELKEIKNCLDKFIGNKSIFKTEMYNSILEQSLIDARNHTRLLNNYVAETGEVLDAQFLNRYSTKHNAEFYCVRRDVRNHSRLYASAQTVHKFEGISKSASSIYDYLIKNYPLAVINSIDDNEIQTLCSYDSSDSVKCKKENLALYWMMNLDKVKTVEDLKYPDTFEITWKATFDYEYEYGEKIYTANIPSNIKDLLNICDDYDIRYYSDYDIDNLDKEMEKDSVIERGELTIRTIICFCNWEEDEILDRLGI